MVLHRTENYMYSFSNRGGERKRKDKGGVRASKGAGCNRTSGHAKNETVGGYSRGYYYLVPS